MGRWVYDSIDYPKDYLFLQKLPNLRMFGIREPSQGPTPGTLHGERGEEATTIYGSTTNSVPNYTQATQVGVNKVGVNKEDLASISATM